MSYNQKVPNTIDFLTILQSPCLFVNLVFNGIDPNKTDGGTRILQYAKGDSAAEGAMGALAGGHYKPKKLKSLHTKAQLAWGVISGYLDLITDLQSKYPTNLALHECAYYAILQLQSPLLGLAKGKPRSRGCRWRP